MPRGVRGTGYWDEPRREEARGRRWVENTGPRLGEQPAEKNKAFKRATRMVQERKRKAQQRLGKIKKTVKGDPEWLKFELSNPRSAHNRRERAGRRPTPPPRYITDIGRGESARRGTRRRGDARSGATSAGRYGPDRGANSSTDSRRSNRSERSRRHGDPRRADSYYDPRLDRT